MLPFRAATINACTRPREIFSRSFSSGRASLVASPFAHRLFNLPNPPPAPSQNHHDLSSFFSYAEQSSLTTNSTTFVGTKYEYTVQASLRRWALDLGRIGGRDDAGIDLVGTWHIPGRELAPFRVIVQCKALKTKLGPNIVRELEGAFRHSPVGWRTTDKIAMLVSPREATKGVRDTLMRSTYPLFWMMMGSDGSLKQVLWNSRVDELGLAPLGVETRYLPNASVGDGDDSCRRRPDVALTWDGREIPDMDYVDQLILQKENEWLSRWGCQDLTEIEKLEFLATLQNSYPEFTQAAIYGGEIEDFEEKKGYVLRLARDYLHGKSHAK